MDIAGRKFASMAEVRRFRASEEEKVARLLQKEKRQSDTPPRTFSAAERREIQDRVRAFYNLMSEQHADLRLSKSSDEFEDTLLNIEEYVARFMQELYNVRKP